MLIFLFSTHLNSSQSLPNNIIIHEIPLKITNLKFKDFDLQDIDLSNNKGKIMILNFWATWCAPCKKEMPSLSNLAEQFKNIEIFAINMEKPNKIKSQAFFDELGISNLDIYFDPDFYLAKKFKMRGLPTTILIDRNGDEFARVIGGGGSEDRVIIGLSFIDYFFLFIISAIIILI